MAVQYRILDFPHLPVKSQLFHVPGAALDGGYTTGGARIISPEPGGRSVLEMQLSLQVGEWSNPFVSWLMSKVNGEIFRVQLTKTPQLATKTNGNNSIVSSVPWADYEYVAVRQNLLGKIGGVYTALRGKIGGTYQNLNGLIQELDNIHELPWNNDQFWLADGEFLEASGASLVGTHFLQVDMADNGEFLKIGHVIGVADSSYMIDEISYENNIASITVTPPLRTSIIAGDMIYMRPYFLGTISNAEEFRQVYDKEFEGNLQPGKLIFQEAIVS